MDLVAHVRRCSVGEAEMWIESEAAPEREEPLANDLVVQVENQFQPFGLPVGVRQEPLAFWPAVARRYAESRGINQELADRWSVCYGAAGRLAGRLILPVRNRSQQIVNYHARNFLNDGGKRYLYPDGSERADQSVLFGEHLWGSTVVFVCEGGFNAISIDQAVGRRFDVAALGGSNVNPMVLLKLSRFDEIHVVMDEDPAGVKATSKLIAALARTKRVVRHHTPVGRDPNDMPVDELRVVLAQGVRV